METPQAPPDRAWQVEHLRPNATRITVLVEKNARWEWWYLLTSDQHWDNPDSNLKLQLKHLDEVKEREAAMMSCGDYFCLMQGKYDKRANKAKVRPEHVPKDPNENYFDLVIQSAATFLEPYTRHIAIIASGNHESAIEQRHEFSVTQRFVSILNDRTGSNILASGFSGWVSFSFRTTTTTINSIVLHYDHGYGGGGPVTADMIQTSRRTAYLPDADIICHGHTHDQWVREFARVRYNSANGNIFQDIQTHIKLPSYKDEYKDGRSGWAVAAKGMPPKPLGAYWLRFFYDWRVDKVLYEVIRAQ